MGGHFAPEAGKLPQFIKFSWELFSVEGYAAARIPRRFVSALTFCQAKNRLSQIKSDASEEGRGAPLRVVLEGGSD
jgi:hypothetical protein